jgi:hypothetical protein
MTISRDINLSRIFGGGVIAGVVLFIVAGIFNGGILAGDFQTWALGMGSLIHPQPQSTSLILWAIMSLIYGFAGVFIYACMRAPVGPGPKTALYAGLFLWGVSKLTVALDLFALGLLTNRLIIGQLVVSAIGIVLGVLAGAWFYKVH